MKNSKFLDDYKRSIASYSIIIIIIFISSLIVYSPTNESISPEINSLFLINYSTDNVSISNEMVSNPSLISLIGTSPNVPLVKIISNPFNSTVDSESISQSANFIGIVIALLFTLIVLPIQYILGRYSQELVERVFNDKTFKFTLGFFIFVFLVEIFELAIFGLIKDTYWSYIVLTINFTLIILALFTFILFILRIFHLLDIRNHLNDIKDEIIRIIPLACKNPDYLKIVVEKTEIIFDSIQKALKEDRFEIVISGLNNIQEIGSKYIDKCEIDKNNKFMQFIIGALFDTKDVISINNNPKNLKKLVSISIVICKKMFLKNKPSNFISEFIDLLKDIVLNTEIVKTTSSVQIEGVKGLFIIGKESIGKDNSRLIQVISSLGKIGRIDKLSDVKSKKLSEIQFKNLYDVQFKLRGFSNKKLSILLFLSFDKLEFIYEFNLNRIIEEINQNVICSLSGYGIDIISKDISPFIDPNKEYSLANFFMKISKNPDEYTLKLMNIIIENYSRYVELCIEKLDILIKALPDIVLILYSNYKTLAFNLSIISSLSSPNEKLFDILQNQIDIFYSVLYYNFEYYANMKFKFREYIILIPLSFYLISNYNKEAIFNDIIEKNVLKILNLIKEWLKKYNEKLNCKEINDEGLTNLENLLIEIYPYLILIGTSLYENHKESDFMRNIWEVFSEILGIYRETNFYGELKIFPDFFTLPSFHDIDDHNLNKNLEEVQKFSKLNINEFMGRFE